ncbi:hypothetical protein [Streptomyces sp. NBC_01538]|uniref:hypothetical protein n=1 Tax=Streptomyces sp. NBC_01538 TaxID=2903897 RepID=UPI00386EFBD7
MSSRGTTDTATLSAECTVGQLPDYTDMHDRCRQTKDLPVHHSAPRILLQRRCRCACHRLSARATPSDD